MYIWTCIWTVCPCFNLALAFFFWSKSLFHRLKSYKLRFTSNDGEAVWTRNWVCSNPPEDLPFSLVWACNVRICTMVYPLILGEMTIQCLDSMIKWREGIQNGLFEISHKIRDLYMHRFFFILRQSLKINDKIHLRTKRLADPNPDCYWKIENHNPDISKIIIGI